jgi:alpha-L-arabinofuranosidase
MSDQSSAARIVLDADRAVGEISPLLFGGFVEHLGRCVYGGIYDPDSPLSDERGFRTDVLAALKDMRLTTVRYPGGNFVSGYDWRDGVGPRDRRPRRRDLAWQSIETNQFGTDEFMQWCRALGAEPMMGLNFGTGTIQDAADLVEYCNAPVGTEYADRRARNGHPQPYGVKYWCLGNEMDGPWQMGALSAQEYGRKAREAGKLMKWHDRSIRTILCGSSNATIATFPEWDRVALEEAWEQTDYLALHNYATNWENDTPSYLAYAVELEHQVDTLSAILRYVKAKRRSKHDVSLSWDEWNVWYKDRRGDGKWAEAPHLCEEVYNLEDALVVAQWMSVMLRRCDVLKIACIAQVVNVIAPMLTTRDGLLKQSTYYPFVLFAQHASGVALNPLVACPRYETKRFGDAPLLDVSATHDPATGRGAVFIVNRSLGKTLPTEITWRGGTPPRRVTAVHRISGIDPKAANSFERPGAVVPEEVETPGLDSGIARLDVPPLSFTVLAVDGMR